MTFLVLLALLFNGLAEAGGIKRKLPTVIRTAHHINKGYEIHLGGIFPMSGGWAGGVGCLPAIIVALEHVNNNASILPQHRLILHANDSQCDAGLGTNVLYELLYTKPVKTMLLGPGCSMVSTFVAEAAKMWDLIVLSYGSSSPALSERTRFSTFFRTHPSAILDNTPRLAFIQRMGWTHISVLQQVDEIFQSTAKSLEKICSAANVTVTRETFQSDVRPAVMRLKQRDARVIVGLFYDQMAIKIICQAYKEEMYGPRYVWLLIGWYKEGWWRCGSGERCGGCDQSEIEAALEGHITVESLFLDQLNGESPNGWTASAFQRYLVQDADVAETVSGFVEAPLAYDAVWAAALALHRTVESLKREGRNISDFDYTNGGTTREKRNSRAVFETLFREMKNTDFRGLRTG